MVTDMRAQAESTDDDSDEGIDRPTGKRLWAVFHEEYFSRIHSYMKDRKGLREVTDRILNALGVSTNYGADYPHDDIDPFTLISKVTALDGKRFLNRKRGYELIKKEFNLSSEIPTDNAGVPKQPMNNSTFSCRTGLSWEFFDSAVKYRNHQSDENRVSFIEAFDALTNTDEVTWVRAPKATASLFLARPLFLSDCRQLCQKILP